jgi:hypothetical protein
MSLLGPRPDVAEAATGMMFWMKLAYPAAVALVAVACIERLSRPGASAARRAPWLVVPVILLAFGAAVQLVNAAPDHRMSLILGGSAMVCPWLISACAAPVFVALVWALRGLAPTRPRLAGAAAGLAASALGAAVYAVHCAEPGGAFVLIWYSLGILLPTAVGALLGPRLLRWS